MTQRDIIFVLFEIFYLFIVYIYSSALSSTITKQKKILLFIISACIDYLFYFFTPSEIIYAIESLGILYFILYYISRKKLKSLILSIVYLVIGIITEFIGTYIFIIIYGVNIDSFLSNDSLYTLGLAVSRFLLLIFAITYSKLSCRVNKYIQPSYWFPYIISSIGSIIVLAIIYYYTKNEGYNFVGVIIISSILMTINFVMIFMYENLQEKTLVKSEMLQLINSMEYQKKSYEKEKYNRTKEQINLHDMKNYYLYLLKLANDNNYEKLKDEINNKCKNIILSDDIKTGNSSLDYILNHKIELASIKQIIISHDIKINTDLSMDSSDLIILLGNALDNAIEGSPSSDNRIVFKLLCEKGFLKIQIKNDIDSERKQAPNGLFYSTKSTPGHGYGLLSMQSIVQKYNGTMNLMCNDTNFIVDIMLYLQEKKHV